jgi:hypothetical protein
MEIHKLLCTETKEEKKTEVEKIEKYTHGEICLQQKLVTRRCQLEPQTVATIGSKI